MFYEITNRFHFAGGEDIAQIGFRVKCYKYNVSRKKCGAGKKTTTGQLRGNFYYFYHLVPPKSGRAKNFSADMLYVFQGADQLSMDFLQECKYFLPRRRLDQLEQYRLISDRKLCAVAYVVLVYALKNEGLFHSLPEFGYGDGGKPFLENYPGIHFNFSHCRNVAVCCLSGEEMGVDVENVFAYDEELARALCNDDEYRWIGSFPEPGERAKNLTKLWTRKESVVKWRGTGLNCDPREILRNGFYDAPDDDFHISTFYYQSGNFYVSACTNRH